MPLYKRQGYKWRPYTNVYMDNYIPPILNYPLFKPFFAQFNWYDSFKPVVNQLENTEKKGGMPIYKYVSNRFLSAIENLLLGSKLSEFHTGYRAFSNEVLEHLPLHVNSDDFVFDNEMLAQIIWFGYRVGELSCPTKYFKDGSSINLSDSIRYGIGVVWTSLKFRFQKWNLCDFAIFRKEEEKVQRSYYRSIE